MSKRASTRQKQLEEEDPLVIKIAEEGNIDIEYLERLNALEDNTDKKELPNDNELRQLSGCTDQMSIVTVRTGTKLIVKTRQRY